MSDGFEQKKMSDGFEQKKINLKAYLLPAFVFFFVLSKIALGSDIEHFSKNLRSTLFLKNQSGLSRIHYCQRVDSLFQFSLELEHSNPDFKFCKTELNLIKNSYCQNDCGGSKTVFARELLPSNDQCNEQNALINWKKCIEDFKIFSQKNLTPESSRSLSAESKKSSASKSRTK